MKARSYTMARSALAAAGMLLASPVALSQTSSVLAQNKANPAPPPPADTDPAIALAAYAWFNVPQPLPVVWRKHDHVQIIIRETSTARSQQALDTSKDYESRGEIKDFPQLTLNDLLNGVLKASENANPAKLDIKYKNEFAGDGKYTRTDDLSARVTAEVIEVQPNGHLVLEARTFVQTDLETSTIVLSGECDPQLVTPAGTILSNQLFDLRVVKSHQGELKQATKKGLFARVLDTIFAF